MKLDRRGRMPTPIPDNIDLASMYLDEKLSLNQISDRTGLPTSRIITVLKRHGIKRRTPAEGAALRNDRKPRVVPKKRRTID